MDDALSTWIREGLLKQEQIDQFEAQGEDPTGAIMIAVEETLAYFTPLVAINVLEKLAERFDEAEVYMGAMGVELTAKINRIIGDQMRVAAALINDDIERFQ